MRAVTTLKQYKLDKIFVRFVWDELISKCIRHEIPFDPLNIWMHSIFNYYIAVLIYINHMCSVDCTSFAHNWPMNKFTDGLSHLARFQLNCTLKYQFTKNMPSADVINHPVGMHLMSSDKISSSSFKYDFTWFRLI